MVTINARRTGSGEPETTSSLEAGPEGGRQNAGREEDGTRVATPKTGMGPGPASSCTSGSQLPRMWTPPTLNCRQDNLAAASGTLKCRRFNLPSASQAGAPARPHPGFAAATRLTVAAGPASADPLPAAALARHFLFVLSQQPGLEREDVVQDPIDAATLEPVVGD